ncbi:hypothetical protein PsorP6_014578 [Peronosclerospora sorghi]|uniref:Uncharacterized protein n=1 Tax=Peronosclerospora sorghi TaxID=230839 RepID=A0ACC0VRB7_9STRA|nr:hypothetical protein PsorP6_014578 [Peronosclerospora sorghi]
MFREISTAVAQLLHITGNNGVFHSTMWDPSFVRSTLLLDLLLEDNFNMIVNAIPMDVPKINNNTSIWHKFSRGQHYWKDLAGTYNLGQARKHQRDHEKLPGKFQRLRNASNSRALTVYATIEARSSVIEFGGPPFGNELTEDDQLLLCAVLEDLLPARDADWTAVEPEYNARRPVATLQRTTEDPIDTLGKL